MATQGTVTRDITPEECNWLDDTISTGATVYAYSGCTYGCISREGDAATFDQSGGHPFFEVPHDAVKWERATA